LPVNRQQRKIQAEWSSSECPRNHQREFFSPEWATVRPSSLIQDDIRTCIA
jgi:hypothetical protein